MISMVTRSKLTLVHPKGSCLKSFLMKKLLPAVNLFFHSHSHTEAEANIPPAHKTPEQLQPKPKANPPKITPKSHHGTNPLPNIHPIRPATNLLIIPATRKPTLGLPPDGDNPGPRLATPALEPKLDPKIRIPLTVIPALLRRHVLRAQHIPVRQHARIPVVDKTAQIRRRGEQRGGFPGAVHQVDVQILPVRPAAPLARVPRAGHRAFARGGCRWCDLHVAAVAFARVLEAEVPVATAEGGAEVDCHVVRCEG